MQTAIVLHHYPASPFAEKIRLFLGYKAASWRSVEIPMVMPKPKLMPLTGGYRKTPVMQIGADIYCDTALILDELHQRLPDPLLIQEGALSDITLAAFADSSLFAAAVSWVFQPSAMADFFRGKDEAFVQAFLADRKAFRAASTAPRPSLGQAKDRLVIALSGLEQQLSDCRSFVWGASPSRADFCLFHPLWFVQQAQSAAVLLDDYPQVGLWLERMSDFGHGNPEPMSADEALALATVCEPAAIEGPEAARLTTAQAAEGLQLGAWVEIKPNDYGMDPVHGRLCYADQNKLVIAREEAGLGLLHVHFPQLGYQAQPSQA
ncbi:MAG: glutathione S-transferase [Betaproteobacteria bacterium]|jgi:glutathione S-transferase|nr:glutathione S-transferase [Betaproteobacteria bacterium]NBS38693.1 glutathione S-transferase [Betaproteobacteria bacterium]NBT71943.1 glutathione S-transferase [Betaproteobacteria bacterium]NBT81893.1 glutathione S-transferase [Betaproteobacteria bacterium]NBY56719.1 glutathione S-transferase [Betaproteobacteria bacterium]